MTLDEISFKLEIELSQASRVFSFLPGGRGGGVSFTRDTGDQWGETPLVRVDEEISRCFFLGECIRFRYKRRFRL